MNGNSIICYKPNEIIEESKHGRYLDLWHRITGQDITYTLYAIGNNEHDGIDSDQKLPERLYFKQENVNDNLEKTDMKFSSKLKTLTMEYLRSKERETLEKSGKTLKQVWEQVESNRQLIIDTHNMLEAICLEDYGGKEKMLEELKKER